MADLQLRPLSPHVFDQVPSVLWQAKAFEAPLAAALVPERWDAWALAAAHVPDERLERVRSGGLEGGGANDRAIAELIVAEMRQSGAGLIAIDDMAEPGDGFLKRERLPYATVGDTIVYVAERPDVAEVETAWCRASSAAGHMGLLTTHALPMGEDPNYDVGAAVDAAPAVLLVAYDGEGVVILKRR